MHKCSNFKKYAQKCGIFFNVWCAIVHKNRSKMREKLRQIHDAVGNLKQCAILGRKKRAKFKMYHKILKRPPYSGTIFLTRIF